MPPASGLEVRLDPVGADQEVPRGGLGAEAVVGHGEVLARLAALDDGGESLDGLRRRRERDAVDGPAEKVPARRTWRVRIDVEHGATDETCASSSSSRPCAPAAMPGTRASAAARPAVRASLVDLVDMADSLLQLLSAHRWHDVVPAATAPRHVPSRSVARAGDGTSVPSGRDTQASYAGHRREAGWTTSPRGAGSRSQPSGD